MAKRREPESKRDGLTAVNVQLPDDLVAAMEKMVESHRPETGKTAIIKHALEKYLAEYGYWPIPTPK